MLKEDTQNIEAAIARLDWERQPERLYEPMRYALAMGGKRLRPALAFTACRAVGGVPGDETEAVALALEIFHNFTLVHDDVMDRATLRRGKPTVGHRWSENVAILSGDTLHIKAFGQLARLSEAKIGYCLSAFAKMAAEVCEGQQYDMDFETRERVSIPEYLEMIRLKTAVLLATALDLGAYVGGADAETRKALYDYGIGLGMAFQLQDDYLDVYGDERTFGKKIGGDILCGKKTFLLLMAYDLADEYETAALDKWMNFAGNDAEKIAGVTAVYNRMGVPAKVVEAQAKYIDNALEALERVNFADAEAVETLRNLALKTRTRQA